MSDLENDFKEKNYIIKFNKVDSHGNLYKPGCFTNLEKFNYAEDEIGIYAKDICTYIPNSIITCENCPKKITALHMCNLLKE